MALAADLFRDCRGGNSVACVRLHELYYLLPRLVKELELLKIGTLIPPGESWVLEKDVMHACIGDTPPSAIVAPSDQLKASVELRDALKNVTTWLNSEIERLEKQVKDTHAGVGL